MFEMLLNELVTSESFGSLDVSRFVLIEETEVLRERDVVWTARKLKGWRGMGYPKKWISGNGSLGSPKGWLEWRSNAEQRVSKSSIKLGTVLLTGYWTFTSVIMDKVTRIEAIYPTRHISKQQSAWLFKKFTYRKIEYFCAVRRCWNCWSQRNWSGR